MAKSVLVIWLSWHRNDSVFIVFTFNKLNSYLSIANN
jgi:hypothetical protein